MGVPVFGFAEGATAELVDEDCGVLTKSKKLEDLVSDFELFRSKKRDRKLISERIREKLTSQFVLWLIWREEDLLLMERYVQSCGILYSLRYNM